MTPDSVSLKWTPAKFPLVAHPFDNNLPDNLITPTFFSTKKKRTVYLFNKNAENRFDNPRVCYKRMLNLGKPRNCFRKIALQVAAARRFIIQSPPSHRGSMRKGRGATFIVKNK